MPLLINRDAAWHKKRKKRKKIEMVIISVLLLLIAAVAVVDQVYFIDTSASEIEQE